MTPLEFLATLDPARRETISAMRDLILKHDKTVTETVTPMMGQDMLYYTVGGVMKYALASPKSHMSIHSMVMYGTPGMREKFIDRLPKAKFQKGCINFKNSEEMPLAIFEEIIEGWANVQWPPQMFLDRFKKK